MSPCFDRLLAASRTFVSFLVFGLAAALLTSCGNPLPKPLTPRDPQFWTAEGHYKYKPAEEAKAWQEIEAEAAKNPPFGLHPEPLVKYLRQAPDGPHVAQVRELLETRVVPPKNAAVLSAPDASCRARTQNAVREMFRLEPGVAVPDDVFSTSPVLRLPSRDGQPAPVEKRILAELIYDSVDGHCTVVDRYGRQGRGLGECRCEPLRKELIGQPSGQHASALRMIGRFTAMRDACNRFGISLDADVAGYIKLLMRRANGEVVYDERLRQSGKRQMAQEEYDVKVYRLLLADLRRGAFSQEAYDEVAAELKPMTRDDAPQVCKGAQAMMVDQAFPMLWSLKARQLGKEALWPKDQE